MITLQFSNRCTKIVLNLFLSSTGYVSHVAVKSLKEGEGIFYLAETMGAPQECAYTPRQSVLVKQQAQGGSGRVEEGHSLNDDFSTAPTLEKQQTFIIQFIWQT